MRFADWNGADRGDRLVKFQTLWIDGYGKFAGRELALVPGLQIVAGPNEQGKSTLRHFVTDMLYGQKRSATQRVYEDSNEIREPWEGPGTYGGRLLYALDSGRLIEVQRSFDRADEWVKVYDRTDAREISGEFATLRNRESTFAERHLRMSKEVFLGTATISHITLDELGDKQALVKIREKLLSVADSGGSYGSAETAVRRIAERIEAIGRPSARSKPLPMARARLADLQKEIEHLQEVRRDLAAIEQQRSAVQDAISELLERRHGLERELDTIERIARAVCLRKADELSGQIAALTARCFALSHVRDFPLEQAAEVRPLVMGIEAAKAQLDRARKELDDLRRRHAAETARLGPDGMAEMEELDPEYETRLADIDARIARFVERIAGLDENRATALARQEEAARELAALPDYTRVAADPVTWLSQLSSSSGFAVRARDDERGKLDQLEMALQKRNVLMYQREALFSEVPDFPGILREYEANLRQSRESMAALRREADELAAHVDELGKRVPPYATMAVVCAFGAAVCAVTAFITNPGFLFASAFAGVGLIAFSSVALYAQRLRKRQRARQVSAETGLAAIEESSAVLRRPIEDLMEEGGCATARELEAQYDRYRQECAEIAVIGEQLEQQRARAAEADDRVRKLHVRIRETFLKLNEDISREEDVAPAAARAIGRYQEFRDAKRRAHESAEALERRQREIDALAADLERLRKEELELSLEARRLMRANHYPDEEKSDSALKALRAYRIRSAQVRQRRGSVAVLEGNIAMAEQQARREEDRAGDQVAGLARILERVGVTTVEEYLARADEAARYREWWRERGVLADRLEALLGGVHHQALRAQVVTDGPVPEAGTRDESGVRQDLESLRDEIEACRQREHALHIALAERTAGTRTLNEVEEERAATERRVWMLELEIQASTHAASAIEEVTRERHSRIAPQLAALASGYLSEITGGRYGELLINRDMQISIRIPQTKSLDQDPENRLSKGTVDQIYLALRIALVRTLSAGAESVPMLLDDPFANYDDARLERAMKLLSRIAETNQVLLFTCREDVVRAAEANGTPITRL